MIAKAMQKKAVICIKSLAMHQAQTFSFSSLQYTNSLTASDSKCLPWDTNQLHKCFEFENGC